MPVSKKRKSARPRPREDESAGGGGLMGRMRGGIKNVAGAGPKKPESLLSKALTWALVLLAAWLVARRFGLLP